MNKIRITLIFGGRSAEHEVSIRSAKNIFLALNEDEFETSLVYIDREGHWFMSSGQALRVGDHFSDFLVVQRMLNQQVHLVLGGKGQWRYAESGEIAMESDVIFPVLHGPNGEDGSIQGYLELARVPYVGARVLGSAIGMDKDIMKRLLRDADLPIGNFLTLSADDPLDYQAICKSLGSVIFVKPARLGSSIGVSKVHGEAEFIQAVQIAFQYDRKIIIEEYISGREVECSVLGGPDLVASMPGEVKPSHDFYSYEAKYLDPHGATFAIPADLNKEASAKIQELAVKTFSVLECEGMARVDFFVTSDNRVFINEINTIPGFTAISMYPKMWEVSGISYEHLIKRLVQVAIQSQATSSSLKNELF